MAIAAYAESVRVEVRLARVGLSESSSTHVRDGSTTLERLRPSVNPTLAFVSDVHVAESRCAITVHLLSTDVQTYMPIRITERSDKPLCTFIRTQHNVTIVLTGLSGLTGSHFGHRLTVCRAKCGLVTHLHTAQMI